MKNTPIILIILLLSASALFSQTISNEGRIYFKIKDQAALSLPEFDISQDHPSLPSEIERLLTPFSIRKIEKPFQKIKAPVFDRIYCLHFQNAGQAAALIRALQQLDFVEYAETEPVCKTDATPNDPLYTDLFNDYQWYLRKINAPAAWDLGIGNSNITIALIDNEIATYQIDLAGNLWTNPGEIAGNGMDDDGNGYVDDITGWDVADNDNNPSVHAIFNPLAHGTLCAGLAAASTDNNILMASISWNVRLIPVKATMDTGQPDIIDHPIAGLAYAILCHPDIISMSWGTEINSPTLEILINEASSQGIICVAAAGNDNTSAPRYPAAYPGVVAVGATDVNDVKAGFSNYGDWVDVMAPGENIFTLTKSGYGTFNGTSMSCPLVAGLLALMKSYSHATADELIDCLKTTCVNIDAQNPAYVGLIGGGRIDAEAALQCLHQSPHANFAANKTSICPGQCIRFSDQSTGGSFTSWNWQFEGGIPSTSTDRNPQCISFATYGTHSVTLQVSNDLGTDTKTIEGYITVTPPTATLLAPPSLSVCDSSMEIVAIHFTGSPPFDAVLREVNSGTQFSIHSNTPVKQLFMHIAASFNQFELLSMHDAYCEGTVGPPVQYTVVSCCETHIVNGDFENGTGPCANQNFFYNELSPDCVVQVFPDHCRVLTLSDPVFHKSLLIDGPNVADHVADPIAGTPAYSKVWCQNVDVPADGTYQFSYMVTNSGPAVRLQVMANNTFSNPVYQVPYYSAYGDWNKVNTLLTLVQGPNEICISQVDNFNGAGYDYFLDFITLAAASPEICNGLDDNCNGLVDEGCNQPQPCPNPLITALENGDFAQPGTLNSDDCQAGTGWDYSTSPGTPQYTDYQSPGDFWIDLTPCWSAGNGVWIEKQVSLLSVEQYQLSFDLGCWGGGDYSDAGVVLTLDGIPIGSRLFNSQLIAGVMIWKNVVSDPFSVTNSGTHTLRLTGEGHIPSGASGNPQIIGVDNVVLLSCMEDPCANDTEFPILVCPPDVLLPLPPGQCSEPVFNLTPLTSDNCPGLFLSYLLMGATNGSGVGDASGSLFNLGTTQLIYILTDANGNSISCVTTIVLEAGAEICNNGIDDNCDGRIDESDLSVGISPSATLICNGGSAILCAVATGGAGGYTFLWNTTQGDPCIFASAGTYCVTVTDAAGCTASACITIVQSPSIITYDMEQHTLCCVNSGSISLTALGGFGQLHYQWDDPAHSSGPNLDHLAAGTYCVTVTDDNGCFATDCVVVSTRLCEKPKNVHATNISKIRATIRWKTAPCATKYQLRYKRCNASSWTNRTLPAPATGNTISGLLCNTCYQYQMRTFCCNSWSGWSPLASFTTAACFTGGGGSESRAQNKQVEADGISAVPTLRIFPNPSTGLFTLEWHNMAAEPVRITLLKADGQRIGERTLLLSPENPESELDLRDQAAGVYIIQINTGKERWVERLIKL